jgi:hypothetical protein
MRNHIDRVRSDLETMKAAIDPGPPYQRETVRFALAIAAGGLLSLLAGLHPGFSPALQIVVLSLPLAAVVVHFAITRRHSDLSATPGQLRQAHMHYAPYIVLLVCLPLLIWARVAGAVSAEFASSGMIFIFGAAILATAVTIERQRYLLATAIPMLLCAVAALWLSWSWTALVGVVAVSSGLLSAAVMSLTLLRSAEARAAN